MTETLELLDPAAIDTSAFLRSRGVDESVVDEIRAALLEDAEVPSISVLRDAEGALYLADGMHRLEAHRRVGLRVPARVGPGDARQARLAWLAANAKQQSIRWGYGDRRSAVITLLRDEEWGVWSDREIGERCGASHTLVWRIRHELMDAGEPLQESKKYVIKTGERAGLVIHRKSESKRTAPPRPRSAKRGFTAREVAAVCQIFERALAGGDVRALAASQAGREVYAKFIAMRTEATP